jgi:hypothetical protein
MMFITVGNGLPASLDASPTAHSDSIARRDNH